MTGNLALASSMVISFIASGPISLTINNNNNAIGGRAAVPGWVLFTSSQVVTGLSCWMQILAYHTAQHFFLAFYVSSRCCDLDGDCSLVAASF